MKRALLLGLLLPACFDDCLGDGGGGSGGGGGSDVEPFAGVYDLVEASGEWSLTGTATTSSTCTNTTTASKRTFALPAPVKNAATYTAGFAVFTAFGQLTGTREPRMGTTACTGSAARACPSTAEVPQTGMTFVTITTEPMLPANAPDGFAFVPVLSGPTLPELCDGTPFATSPVVLRGKPISIAQLKSGRFVVEASGTTALLPPETDPADPPPVPVDGTLTFSFRLVFQTEGYDPSHAVAAPTLPSYDECLIEPTIGIDDLEAAEAAFARGDADIALDAKGCHRLAVTRNGPAVTVAHALTRGTKLVFDAASGTTRAERDAVVDYQLGIDATGLHEKHDLNLDGTFDETVETTFIGGQWQSTVLSLGTRKVTRTRASLTTMQVRIEDGATLEDDFVSATKQPGCFKDTDMTDPACASPPATGCGGATAACMGQQLKDLKKALTDALKKGGDCMKAAGYDGFQPKGKGLTLLAAGKVKFQCSTDPCAPFGSFETAANEDGSHDFTVNVTRATGAELAKTLFHEMLHSDPSFTHDDDLVDRAGKACKLQIADRTYACETMCFAPSRGGSCACERCLNPKKHAPSQDICMKCSKFGDCPGRQGIRSNGLVGNISQGIGAWCGRGKIFCDTKAECDAACTIGGGCQQIKTVCDDACN